MKKKPLVPVVFKPGVLKTIKKVHFPAKPRMNDLVYFTDPKSGAVVSGVVTARHLQPITGQPICCVRDENTGYVYWVPATEVTDGVLGVLAKLK